MINLLPQANQKQLKASLYNVILARIIILFVITSVIISTLFGAVHLIFKKESEQLDQKLAIVKEESRSYQETKKKSEKIARELKDAKSIFDEQKHYSNFLSELAKSLPNDVAISAININPDILKKPTIVKIKTLTDDKVIETKRRMEQSYLIDLISINDIQTNTDPKAKLPKTATLSITFNPKGFNDSLKWQADDLERIEKERQERIRKEQQKQLLNQEDK